jgi:bacterioferritin
MAIAGFLSGMHGYDRSEQRRCDMRGNPKVIEELNARLSEELGAINQYMVHAEMCENWRYGKLADPIEKRAIVEMKHAEKLIERILFLDGRPIVSELAKIHIGADVPAIHAHDLAAELDAVEKYNRSITVAREAGDDGSRAVFESILADEEEHVDWVEAQLFQIDQIGLQNYLIEQVE